MTVLLVRRNDLDLLKCGERDIPITSHSYSIFDTIAYHFFWNLFLWIQGCYKVLD